MIGLKNGAILGQLQTLLLQKYFKMVYNNFNLITSQYTITQIKLRKVLNECIMLGCWESFLPSSTIYFTQRYLDSQKITINVAGISIKH